MSNLLDGIQEVLLTTTPWTPLATGGSSSCKNLGGQKEEVVLKLIPPWFQRRKLGARNQVAWKGQKCPPQCAVPCPQQALGAVGTEMALSCHFTSFSIQKLSCPSWAKSWTLCKPSSSPHPRFLCHHVCGPQTLFLPCHHMSRQLSPH